MSVLSDVSLASFLERDFRSPEQGVDPALQEIREYEPGWNAPQLNEGWNVEQIQRGKPKRCHPDGHECGRLHDEQVDEKQGQSKGENPTCAKPIHEESKGTHGYVASFTRFLRIMARIPTERTTTPCRN